MHLKLIYGLHFLFILHRETCAQDYLLGAGIGDVTGPAAEIQLIGYANPSQVGEGIHLRQFSRAFIFVDILTRERVVFVSVDVAMISVNVKNGVVETLKKKFGSITYTGKNVMISATHSHSTPGGFHQYVLYQAATSVGFVEEAYNNLITGIVRSIEIAHSNIKPGSVKFTSGELDDSNINRSYASYMLNPPDERARYAHDTDREMVLLKLIDNEGQGIGMINWFPVHPVSMNMSNKYISGDNKGVAQMLFERDMNPGAFVGQGQFVASFANSNLGDVSPNLDGPKCAGTGSPCESVASICPNEELCYAQGPGRDMYESTYIIGERQYKKAKELYQKNSLGVAFGQITSRHQYVDMSDQRVRINTTYVASTCSPAMGVRFSGGTTDGNPGLSEGDKYPFIAWPFVEEFIQATGSQELTNCQFPKKILLPTGEINIPYAWQPSILELQILRIGQVVIVGVPGELTTMAGRRLKEAVKEVFIRDGFPSSTTVVIAGLANDYCSYITTFEEYQGQRYEAASTVHGPHTLEAYIQRYTSIADYLAKGLSLNPGTPPPDLSDSLISFQTPVLFDGTPLGKGFGDVITDAESSYQQGERVDVTFVTGHPRNNPRLEGTYLIVEKMVDNEWTVIARDSDWETRYRWERTNVPKGCSVAHSTWCIPLSQDPGTYRIQHFGDKKESGNIGSFTGSSSEFQVTIGTMNATAAMRICNAAPKCISQAIKGFLGLIMAVLVLYL